MKALVVLAAILSLAPQAHAQTPIPVGAFVQNPANATTHKAMGINTYWNLWRVNRPLATQLQQIAAAGMFVIAEDSGPDGLFLSSFKTSHAAQIKGYLIPDEPDAAVHNGACLPFATITSTIAAITSRDATRPIGVNYSPGMNDPNWVGRGTCWHQHKEYLATTNELDILAFDVYPSQQPNGGGFEFYDDMRAIYNGTNLLRTYSQFAKDTYFPAHSIDLQCATPANQQPTWKSMRAQVWAGFVAGGKGPLWFGSCFNGTQFGSETRWLDLPNQVARITAVNAEIQEMSTFLNNPELSPGAGRVISVSPAGAQVRCTFRLGVQNRHSAVCVNLDPRINATVTFHLGGAGSPMEVLKEGRQVLPGAGNLYTDTFTGPAVHSYRTRFGTDPAIPPASGDPGAVPLEITAAFGRSANPPGGAVGTGLAVGWYFDSSNRGALRFPLTTAQLNACVPSAVELRVSVAWPFGSGPVTTRGVKVGPWNGQLGSIPENTPASGRYALSAVPTPYATSPDTLAVATGYRAIALGGSILADLPAAAAAGQASFALQGTAEANGPTVWLESHTSPNPPKLRLSCTQ